MCEGCDTLCLKCEAELERCIKCDCICHCGTTCMCECAVCEHEKTKETYQNNSSETRSQSTRLENKL
jgi:hypothetical protein